MFTKGEKERIISAVESALALENNDNLEADIKLLKKVRNIETFDDVVENLNNAEVKLSEE